MGKQERLRKENGRLKLMRLIDENPAQFETEWERRLAGWIYDIRFSTGKDGRMNDVPVFHIADNALRILSACGEKAVLLYGKRTEDPLKNLCCRELSRHFGHELYKVNTTWIEVPTKTTRDKAGKKQNPSTGRFKTRGGRERCKA